MSGHTPGPWEFVPFKEHEDALRKGEGDVGGFRAAGGWVCHFGDSTTYYPSEGEPPSEADARLIAAAPELLEACESFVRGEIGGEMKIRAAIAKATGAQP